MTAALRRLLGPAALVAASLLLLAASPALAGSPHFVDDQTTLSQQGNTLTVHFKLAGLGDEAQVHVVLTADAACVNPGSNKPQAENKQAVLAEGDFPVQNGRAEGDLSGTATFDPSSPCPVPMTIVYSNVVVTDTTHGISLRLA
jgi:type II secretory pathway pseudopilin PulG